MGFYVTTSRKPSMSTRKLARWLALLFGGEVENRGKRSIGEAIERAEQRGLSRIMVVGESHGNPATISFMGAHGWEKSLVLSSVSLPPESTRGVRIEKVSGGVALDGAGRGVLMLFGVREAKAAAGVQAVAGGRELKFTLGGEPVGPLLKIAGMK